MGVLSGGSIEHILLSKIITESSLQEVQQSGVKPMHWGTWEDRYSWVVNYHQLHSQVPTERAWSTQWGHVEVLDTEGETFSGLIAELLSAYRQRVVVDAVSNAMAKLESDDTPAAMQLLQSGLQKASIDAARLRDVDLIETWEERLAAYEEMRSQPNALRGIPTGFYGLDKITHGFRPQQYIVAVGEIKRKKSWLGLFAAIACHRSGKIPMIVTYEMSNQEQSSRFDAATARLPYDAVLRGALTDLEMERLRRTMILHKNMQPFLMSEDTTSMTTVGAVANKLQEHQPHLLIIDGMYLMDDELGEKRGSPQAITNISRGIKRLAQRFDIPIFATTQALPWKVQSQKTRKLDANAIGYSSAMAQDADLLLGIENDPDIDNRSVLRVIEARTAPKAEFSIQWDFSTTSYTEGTDDEDTADGYMM